MVENERVNAFIVVPSVIFKLKDLYIEIPNFITIDANFMFLDVSK